MDQGPEIIENSNNQILSSIDCYLQYIRDNIQQIINDDNLQYSDPMDRKKIYPAFTYTQFCYLLGRLYDRVYSVNLELLQDPPYRKPLLYNKYNNPNIRYNVSKVELAYEVYNKLCAFYGFVCSYEMFTELVGIDYGTLTEWLTSGRSNLLKKARENNKKAVITKFENSGAPLLQLAAGNYKHGLNTPQQERTEAAALDVLPDLLALTENKKTALPGPDNQIVSNIDTN